MPKTILKTVGLSFLVILLAAQTSFAEKYPRTERTDSLLNELLVKLDSSEVYAARKEAAIDSLKARLSASTEIDEHYSLLHSIARGYADCKVDSAIFYLEKLVGLAQQAQDDSVLFRSRMDLANVLSDAGYYMESFQILNEVPRGRLSGELLVRYFYTKASFYHILYNSYKEPESFREEYREQYSQYRDSVLQLADTSGILYLHAIERKEARAGNFDKARHYNAVWKSKINNPRSAQMATCLYDSFAIAYVYEYNFNGEDIDNLLESAILEVELGKLNIASLNRVQTLLLGENKYKEAKKVSDYYFASLLKFGSRVRLIDVIDQTVRVNKQSLRSLRRSYAFSIMAIVLISVLVAALVIAVIRINSSRHKVQALNEELKRSDSIAKGYVGVVFKLYSSYIKRLEVFRAKIHSNLKKDRIDTALELTIPSGEFESEERKALFRHFDTAFVSIFPDFIEKVNSCLRPDAVIVPKKTEILNGELRVLALSKLGIEDSDEIAEMLHCSVKTVYNLRSIVKSRLAVPEADFRRILGLD